MKERPVDLEIKLSEPEKDERLELDDTTQIKVEFKKWREFNHTKHATAFIASVSRLSFKWSWNPITSKKDTAKERAFNYWFNEKKVEAWSKEMSEHEEHSISKATFYRIKNKKKTTAEMAINKEVLF